MPKTYRRLLTASLSLFVVFGLLCLCGNRWNARVRASRVSLAEIAARYPAGSAERAMALRREITRRHHPRWTDLSVSEIADRIEMLASRAIVRPRALVSSSGSSTTPSIAPFFGDYTAISAPAGQGFALLRQPDCSLTYEAGSYVRSLSNPGFTVESTTPHFEQELHSLSGIGTTAGAFPAGCMPINGSGTRAVFLGKTSQNLYLFASDGYDPTTQNNALYYGTLDASYNYHSVSVDDSYPQIHSLTAGDLNQDGNSDIVELSYATCALNVLLGKSDGTFQPGVQYTCAGNSSQGVVMADLNGDGKLDVAVISQDGNFTVLLGSGDGRLHPGQTMQLANSAVSNGANLIVADTRNMGRNDIIVSDGHVLLSNGDGTFTVGTSIAIPAGGATSEFGPNLAAADLNKDGKIDLVYSDGYTIDIFLGAGNGTFTAGPRYVALNNVGYVTVTDIDGDGNLDIYSGMAGGPFFGGDQFEIGEAYVLLGKGDGTFQGATASPASYAGNNLADVNGDGKLDLVSEVTSTGQQTLHFTTYAGRSDGSFAPGGPVLDVGTITVPNVTQGASTYSGVGLKSFTVADVNGDGRADLLFIPNILTSYYQRSILCVAEGNTDASFAQPSCVELPSLLTNPAPLPGGGTDFDYQFYVNNLQVQDLNGDGKPDIFYSYQDNDYGTNSINAGFVVQPGNGDGTFGAPKPLQLYSNPTAPNALTTPQFNVLADVNNDGRADLITTLLSGTYPSYTTTVYLNLNNGDGTFKPATTLQLGFAALHIGVQAADMNGDGKMDLIAEGNDSSGNGNITITPGNGDGTFAQPKLTPVVSGDEINGFTLGDFNGDGKMDVAIVSYDNTYSGIYLGNGDATLQTAMSAYGDPLPSETIPLNVQGPAFAYDFDGDGKLDLLAGDVLLRAIDAPAGPTAGSTASTTSLSASTTTATPGQTVTFTATVTGPAGTTTVPAGTVTFLDASARLGTGTLDSTGKATLSTNSLAAGTHSIVASYGGDSAFAASVSASVTITVVAPSPDFTFASSSTSGTAAQSKPATATLTVSSSNGFAAAVSFACSGQPANVSCSFNPPTVTPAAGASSSTTVSFTETSSMASVRQDSVSLASAGLGVLALFFVRRRRALFARCFAIVALSLALFIPLAGCGGSSHRSKTTGPVSVTITATSGSISHAVQYSLTLQN
jgi:hypothetical protein